MLAWVSSGAIPTTKIQNLDVGGRLVGRIVGSNDVLGLEPNQGRRSALPDASVPESRQASVVGSILL